MSAALDKARAVRSERAAATLWAEVERLREVYGCRCELWLGMSHEELAATRSCATRWQCSVLDFYRRHVPHPEPECPPAEPAVYCELHPGYGTFGPGPCPICHTRTTQPRRK